MPERLDRAAAWYATKMLLKQALAALGGMALALTVASFWFYVTQDNWLAFWCSAATFIGAYFVQRAWLTHYDRYIEEHNPTARTLAAAASSPAHTPPAESAPPAAPATARPAARLDPHP